jgi:hypothetical protein
MEFSLIATESRGEWLMAHWKHNGRRYRRAGRPDLKIDVDQTDRLGAQEERVGRCLGFVCDRCRIRSRSQISEQISSCYVGLGSETGLPQSHSRTDHWNISGGV